MKLSPLLLGIAMALGLYWVTQTPVQAGTSLFHREKVVSCTTTCFCPVTNFSFQVRDFKQECVWAFEWSCTSTDCGGDWWDLCMREANANPNCRYKWEY